MPLSDSRDFIKVKKPTFERVCLYMTEIGRSPIKNNSSSKDSGFFSDHSGSVVIYEKNIGPLRF